MKILFGILGFIFGAGLDEIEGALFGLAIGLLTGTLIQYRDRINSVEQSIASLKDKLEALSETDNQITQQAKPDQAKDMPSQVPSLAITADTQQEQSPEILPDPNFTPATEVVEVAAQDEDGWQTAETSTQPNMIDDIVGVIKNFFTTGNIVVKVAIIILFFGLSFLIKYASDNNLLPIELRLFGITIFGIVMLLFGWRLKEKNHLYALLLQGGAIGVLYLTIFSAGRLNVMPMSLAFILLFGLVVLSCFLAVKQDAKSLALFATAGGFLAPILTSTGQGSHIALFTYYAILNVGIFAIAWFKSWRSLNWLGFVFTFVIASMWGMRFYQPEYFSSTEPFLILFFLFYVAISVLFSLRQAPDLKSLVDGSLVFGTPLVGFALQSQLVNDFEYGHAWSAFSIGVFYFLLNRFLKKKNFIGLETLNEAFFALAVIFLTLCIPFAVDGNWTTAAWALEGAGILWIGLRQKQILAKWFGLLLQFAAAIMFFLRNESLYTHYPLANSFYLGSIMISLAGIFSAYQYSLRENTLTQLEKILPKGLFLWGIFWWFGVNLYEIDHHLPVAYELNVSLIVISVSFLLVAFLSQMLKWRFPETTAIVFLPLLAVFTTVSFLFETKHHPFQNLGYIAWPLGFLISYLLLYRNREKWDKHLLMIFHAISLWLIMFIITWLADDVLETFLPVLKDWSYLVWGITPVICLAVLFMNRSDNYWPFDSYRSSYFSAGLLPVFVYLCYWFVITCKTQVLPIFIKYFPLLNLQDISLLIVLGFMIYWIRLWSQLKLPKPDLINVVFAYSVISLLAFVWLNSIIANAVHFFGGVSFDMESMVSSELFQSVISIAWTLTAFTVMFFASKKQFRKLWFIGATLLGIVIIKLFTIDMHDSGTLTRIVSFISVAVLMLVFSYFSPTPPRQEQTT